MKAFSCPQDPKRLKFKQRQESARKDIERAFRVLQGRWVIIKRPGRSWSINKLSRIMYTCIILHNMIIEGSQNAIAELEEDYLSNPTNIPWRSFEERVAVHARTITDLRDKHKHHQLRADLVEHIWNLED